MVNIVIRRRRIRGGMAEWSMAAVLKTVSPKGDVGSNPTPSAMHHAGCMARHAPYMVHGCPEPNVVQGAILNRHVLCLYFEEPGR